MGKLHSMASRGVDIPNWLAAEGLVFTAGDAALSGTITGTTTFATTTPSLLLDVPDGTVAIPLEVSLYQTGTVGGTVVQVFIEKDNADRYTSGGTAETIYNDFGKTGNCTLYSNSGSAIVATDAYGIPLLRAQVAADVAPAEGAPNEILWTAGRALDFIPGPGAFVIHVVSTTLEMFWRVKWAEIPENWIS